MLALDCPRLIISLGLCGGVVSSVHRWRREVTVGGKVRTVSCGVCFDGLSGEKLIVPWRMGGAVILSMRGVLESAPKARTRC